MKATQTLDFLRGLAIGRATRPGARVKKARATPRIARPAPPDVRAREEVVSPAGVVDRATVAAVVAEVLAALDVAPPASVRMPSVQTDPPSPQPSPQTADRWIGTTEAARRLGVDVSTLRAMVDRAPRTLPGAPVPVAGDPDRAAAKRERRAAEGKATRGTARRLRWDAARLDEWASAYGDWLSTRGRRRRP